MNVSHPKQLKTSLNDAPKYSTVFSNKLAIATHGGKILIQENENDNSTKSLQINNNITALKSTLDGFIVVGTNQYILAVNPVDNSTLFYRPVADEVTCISCNEEDSSSESYVFIGGESGSVTGLTRQGNDTFWTVLDSKITSILVYDQDSLICGSVSGRISKIKIIDNQIVDEVIKGDAVKNIINLGSSQIGYLLNNYTIGVLNCENLESEDLWRVKTKHEPLSIIYSHVCDGILTGFKNKLEIRSRKNGDVLWNHDIENLVNLASENFVVDSSFKIYNLAAYENSQQIEKNNQRMAVIRQEMEMLKFEAVEREKVDNESQQNFGKKVPEVEISIKTSAEHRGIVLEASLSQRSWVIRSLTVFADGLWPGKECKVQSVDFSGASNKMVMVLVEQCPNFGEIRRLDLNVRCAISIKSSQVSTFQNIERNKVLFPLQFYQIQQNNSNNTVLPFIELTFSTTLNKSNLKESFSELFGTNSSKFDNDRTTLISCFDDSLLEIEYLGDRILKICTESISIAAYIIQFIARKSGLTDFSSVCNGYEFEDLRENFMQLDDLKQTVERLRVELNEIGNMTKAAIVHLEDGRKRGDASAMRNATER